MSGGYLPLRSKGGRVPPRSVPTAKEGIEVIVDRQVARYEGSARQDTPLEKAVINLLADLTEAEIAAAEPTWEALQPNTTKLIRQDRADLARLVGLEP